MVFRATLIKLYFSNVETRKLKAEKHGLNVNKDKVKIIVIGWPELLPQTYLLFENKSVDKLFYLASVVKTDSTLTEKKYGGKLH